MTVQRARQQLVNVLRDPNTAQNLEEAQWSSLIATARSANLLGALAQTLQNAAVHACRTAQRHLNGATQLSVRQHQSVVWELHQLQAALGQLSIPVVLLKGGNVIEVRGRIPSACGTQMKMFSSLPSSQMDPWASG